MLNHVTIRPGETHKIGDATLTNTGPGVFEVGVGGQDHRRVDDMGHELPLRQIALSEDGLRIYALDGAGRVWWRYTSDSPTPEWFMMGNPGTEVKPSQS